MKTIHKLVLKSYLGPMFLTFFIVMFVLMMNFIWRYIDELVGKGLDAGVIIELMSYAMANMIPMGLPLAMLLAAIMTLGNLGENYELLAMKSAGMSLPKILKPLIIVVGIIAIGSFFVVNNLVPYANKKMLSILYDIRQQKQVIEFQDGLFFNGIEDMSIRVGKQDPKTHLLRDVLIYDNRNINGNMTTTVADSGYIRLSDDKKYLLVTLFNGETYEQTLRHHIFEKQDGVIPMEGFGFERSDANFSNQSTTKNIAQLDRAIDSLELTVNSATTRSYEPLLREQIFANDNQVLPLPDSARIDKSGFRDALIADSIARPARPGQGVGHRTRQRQELARPLLFRRIDGQGGAQPALPQQDRVAPQDFAADLDHDLLPDRRTAGRHYPQGRPGNADRHLGDLLRHQHLGRKGCARRQLGSLLRHVALVVHPRPDRRLPHLQGDQRLGAARRRLVHRTYQILQGEVGDPYSEMDVGARRQVQTQTRRE